VLSKVRIGKRDHLAPPQVIVFGHVPSHTPDTVAEARYPNSNSVSCGVGTSHVILSSYADEGHVLVCARNKDGILYSVTVVVGLLV